MENKAKWLVRYANEHALIESTLCLNLRVQSHESVQRANLKDLSTCSGASVWSVLGLIWWRGMWVGAPSLQRGAICLSPKPFSDSLCQSPLHCPQPTNPHVNITPTGHYEVWIRSVDLSVWKMILRKTDRQWYTPHTRLPSQNYMKLEQPAYISQMANA